MTENYVETLEKNFWRVSTRWTRFWPKITVLTQNGLKLIFYPGRHGRTRIDSMDSVLTRNGLKLIFYPGRHGLTRIDSVDSVLTENSFFTPVDMVWPVLTRWTRFWPKMTVLTRNGLKLIFYPGRHVLTRIDSVESVLTENDGFDPKTAWNSFFTLVDMV
jgi:hypothetical protein